MKADRLAQMPQNAVALDTETHLISPGRLAPTLVCGSIAEREGQTILSKETTRFVFKAALEAPDAVVCGANFAFDFLVMAVEHAKLGNDLMPGIFAAYDPGRTIIRGHCDGRIFDVQLAEALHAIAQGHLFKDPRTGGDLINPDTGKKGRYSLRTCVSQVLGRDDAKVNDRWRLRYAELEDIPIDQWPFEARQYPIDDAVNTLECALAQAGHWPSCNTHDWGLRNGADELVCRNCRVRMQDAPTDCVIKRPRRNLHDLSRQTYAAWALHLGASWGFSVNQHMVDKLEDKVVAKRKALQPTFVKAGVVRDNGSTDENALKRLVAVAYGAKNKCPACDGSGKVISQVTGKTKVNCDRCGGTGLDLPPEVPRTETGRVSASRDTLDESGDDFLTAYSEFAEKKIESTYIPLLRTGRVCIRCGAHGTKKSPHAEGCTEPGYKPCAVNLRINPLVDTGRTSIEGGMHGLPRKGGVRECFGARPGFVYSSTDYEAGELRTLAQSCLWLVGHSSLAKALLAGLDAHLALAGTMTGKSYEQMQKLKAGKDKATDNYRQAAKAGNFGFGGGMAELTFSLKKRADPDIFTPCENGPHDDHGTRGYNGLRTCILMDGRESCGTVKITQYKDKPCPPVCKVCVENALRLREYWFRQWPEMRPYFKKVQEILDIGNGEVTHFMSKRVRGGVGFTDGANGFFQGLLADAAKNAYCQIVRESYDKTCRVENSEHMTSKYAGGPSPLFGSRPIMLAHDETIAEHPESVAHDAATRVSEIMVEGLRFMCPDLAPACKAEPTLMRHMLKNAQPVYKEGRLQVWEP